MPARLFPNVIAPKRIRTFLILFALALTFPLVALGIFAVSYMAALEEREIENIDRELESAIVTLQTLATSHLLGQNDFAGFHAQASTALRREKAGILLID